MQIVFNVMFRKKRKQNGCGCVYVVTLSCVNGLALRSFTLGVAQQHSTRHFGMPFQPVVFDWHCFLRSLANNTMLDREIIHANIKTLSYEI